MSSQSVLSRDPFLPSFSSHLTLSFSIFPSLFPTLLISLDLLSLYCSRCLLSLFPLSIHSFIQTEKLYPHRARHCSGCWEHGSEQNKPMSFSAHILTGRCVLPKERSETWRTATGTGLGFKKRVSRPRPSLIGFVTWLHLLSLLQSVFPFPR